MSEPATDLRRAAQRMMAQWNTEEAVRKVRDDIIAAFAELKRDERKA
jgi:hypothetical protein